MNSVGDGRPASQRTRRGGPRRWPVLLAVGLALPPAAAPVGAADKVKLKMESSSKNLFAPARFAITAKLEGGSDTDPALHCLTEEWVYERQYETFTNRETNKSIRSRPCADQTQPSTMVREFSNDFYFYQPGNYSVRLMLRNRDGKVVASASLSLRVLVPANPEYQ
ncbi:MAG: hypothetical protein AB1714_13080 [Acidobacteriota bacterium]